MLGRAAILGQSPFFCWGFPKGYTKGVRRAAGRSIPLAIEVSAVKKLKCGCISGHPTATIRCPLLYVVLTKWRKGVRAVRITARTQLLKRVLALYSVAIHRKSARLTLKPLRPRAARNAIWQLQHASLRSASLSARVTISFAN